MFLRAKDAPDMIEQMQSYEQGKDDTRDVMDGSGHVLNRRWWYEDRRQLTQVVPDLVTFGFSWLLIMRVIALKTLKEFWEQHPDAKIGLTHWHERVSKTSYDNPAALTIAFSGADFVGNTRIVFNIARNKYRLIAAFRYDKQICWVKFVGTHSEYDTIDAATVEFNP